MNYNTKSNQQSNDNTNNYGAFVTVRVLCAIYKCCYLLTYLRTNYYHSRSSCANSFSRIYLYVCTQWTI